MSEFTSEKVIDRLHTEVSIYYKVMGDNDTLRVLCFDGGLHMEHREFIGKINKYTPINRVEFSNSTLFVEEDWSHAVVFRCYFDEPPAIDMLYQVKDGVLEGFMRDICNKYNVTYKDEDTLLVKVTNVKTDSYKRVV